MNSGSTVFAQLMEFVPAYEFRLFVDRYHGNYKVKSFSCWDQFLCLAFAQLTYRESLRDIEACLRAAGRKLYHMGIRGKVSRNTLAHANEVRDWRIYRDFAQVLIRNARELYLNDPLAVELDQTAYALDSTIIDLCLSLFPLGQVSKAQGSGEAPYSAGLTCQYPYHSDCHCGNSPRRQCHGRVVLGAGCHLCDGSRLCGLLPPLPYAARLGLLCHSCQEKFPLPAPLLQPSQQIHGTSLRSDRCASWLLRPKRLPRETAAHSLLRFSNQQAFGFSDQQLHLTGFDHCPTVSVPLAGGVVLQMDQATPTYQGLLRHQRKRGQNTNLDRHLGLRAGGHHQKALEPPAQPVFRSTDFERDDLRENSDLTNTFTNR